MFTMPHRDRVDGTVRSTKPLSYGGTLIDGFSLTFAAGRVISRTIQKALVVPTSAVRLTGDGQQFVYRLAGKTVDVANVQVGAVDERIGIIEVLEGLADGDRIIVGNVGTLGRGMQVIIAGEEGGPQRGRQGRGGTQAKQ